MDTPSPNGTSGGRDAGGRFVDGNKLGRGNPLGGKIARLRSVLIQSVKRADMRKIVKTLVNQASGGDVASAKLVLTYVLGNPIETDLLARIEELEARCKEKQ